MKAIFHCTRFLLTILLFSATYGVEAAVGYEEVDKTQMTADASSARPGWEPARAIDGAPETGWHCAEDRRDSRTEWLRLDFGEGIERNINRVTYLARQDGQPEGVFTEYRIYVTSDGSTDPANWGPPVAEGDWFWPTFAEPQVVDFPPKAGRYVIFQCPQAYMGWASAAEVSVYQVPAPIVASPEILPGPGFYQAPKSVTLSTPTNPDAEIWYTLDGTDPEQGGAAATLYVEEIILQAGEHTVKARAFLAGLEPSPVVTATYILTADPLPVLAAPQSIPAGGGTDYVSPMRIRLSHNEPDAEVWYTTDGSEPVRGEPSVRVTEDIRLEGSGLKTLKAKAFADGFASSETMTAVYNLFEVASGMEVQLAQDQLTADASSYDPDFPPEKAVNGIVEIPGWRAAGAGGTEWVRIDLGFERPVSGVHWLASGMTGFPATFRFYVTSDASASRADWGLPVAETEWAFPEEGDTLRISFPPKRGRYVILERPDSWMGWASASEIYVFIKGVAEPTGESEEVDKTQITADASSYLAGWEPAKAIDGSNIGGWHSAEERRSSVFSEWLRLDFGVGVERNISRVTYLPRQDGHPHGTFNRYRIYVTSDSSSELANWGAPVAEGTWTWNNFASAAVVDFAPKQGRFVILERVGALEGWASAAEVSVFQVGAPSIFIPAPEVFPPAGSYLAPAKVRLSMPFNSEGEIWYTLDGSDPERGGSASTQYAGEILLQAGNHHLKARAFAPDYEPSEVVSVEYSFREPSPISYEEVDKILLVAQASSAKPGWEPARAIDEAIDGGWHSAEGTEESNEEWLRLDFGEGIERPVARVKYRSRPDSMVGSFTKYRIFVTSDASSSPANWGTPVAEGDWVWPGSGPERTVDFLPRTGRYVIFQCLDSVTGWATAGEVWVYTAGPQVQLSAPEFSSPEGEYPSPLLLSLISQVAGAEVWYTLDGSEPGRGEPSIRYSGAFAIPGAGPVTVKAKSFGDGLVASPTVSRTFTLLDAGSEIIEPLARSQFHVDASSGEAELAVDENLNSAWFGQGDDPWLRLDFGEEVERSIGRITYRRLPVNNRGHAVRYRVFLTSNPSTEPAQWGTPVAEGEWTWAANQLEQTVDFVPRAERFVIFQPTENYANSNFVTVANLSVFQFGAGVEAQSPQISPPGGTHAGPLRVRFTSPTIGAEMWYTTDGSEPTAGAPSIRYEGEFRLTDPGEYVLRAKAFAAGMAPSETTVAELNVIAPQPNTLYELHFSQLDASASSYFPGYWPRNAVDGNLAYPPWRGPAVSGQQPWLRLDLGENIERPIARVKYRRRSDTIQEMISGYRIYVTSDPSDSPEQWGAPVAEGSFALLGGPVEATVDFAPKTGRFIILQRVAPSVAVVSAEEVWAYVGGEGLKPPASPAVIQPVSGTYPGPLEVTISTPSIGGEIWYTLEGSEPVRGAPSIRYMGPFNLTEPGVRTLKAKVFGDSFSPSETREALFSVVDPATIPTLVDRTLVTATGSSSAPGWPASAAIDGNRNTAWHCAVENQHTASEWIRLDFGVGVNRKIAELRYLPRRDGQRHGTFTEYRIFVTDTDSTDSAEWGVPVAQGELAWETLSVEKSIVFPPKSGRFVIFERVAALEGWASAGELTVYELSAIQDAPTPTIIPGEGSHQTPLTVRITSTEPDAEIWYTLNGSEPIAESRSVRYTGEFVISQLGAVQIKARSYISGLNPSPIATAILNVIPAVAPAPDILPGGGEHEAPVTVRMTSTEGEIWYTLDGTEPQSQTPSLKYTSEFSIAALGTHQIKARTFVTGKEPSPVRTVSIQVIPQNAEELIRVPNTALLADASSSATGWEAGRAIDGRHDTAWHSALNTQDSSSEWVRLAFRDSLEHQVARISYHPRRDGNPHGTFTHYRVFVTSSASTDPAEWGSPVAEGNWTWTQLNVDQFVDFPMKRGRYVIVQCVDSLEGWASASEIGVFEFPDATPRADPPGSSLPPGTYISPVRLSLTTTTPGGEIWYTTDGSDPVQGEPSFEFTGEVELVGSGPVLIKARTFAPDLEPSGISTFSYMLEELAPGVFQEVPKNTMTASASSFAPGWEPFKAIDGNFQSTWHCAVDRQSGTEEWLRLDFGGGIERVIGRLKYHPRSDQPHGTFTRYRIFVTSQESDSPAEWGTPVAEGDWTWETRAEKVLDFTPARGRFVIIQCVAALEGWASAGEITIFETDEDALTRASPPTVSLPGGNYISPAQLQLQSGTAGAAIWYTLDGTEPVPAEPSLLYEGPFLLTGGGSVTLKAKAFADGLDPSSTTTVLYHLTSPAPGTFIEVPKSSIIADASSFAPGWEPAKAIDGMATAWHCAVANQHTQEWLRLDFGAGIERVVAQLKYRGRGDSQPHGTFTSFEIYVTSNPSSDPNDWGEPVFEGTWAWGQLPDDRTVAFTPTSGRFVIIRCTSSLLGWASAGEVTVYTTGSP